MLLPLLSHAQLSDACAWPLSDALSVSFRVDVEVTGAAAAPYLAYGIRCVIMRWLAISAVHFTLQEHEGSYGFTQKSCHALL